MYADLELRSCSKCSESKELKFFSKRSDRKGGKASWCKACLNEWRRSQKLLTPEKYKAYEFKRGLKRNYGISVEIYKDLFKNQNGKCACCGRPEEDFKRKLHVDHDHETGAVRALLCTRCNPGLGYFEYKIERLEKAIAYIRKFKK